MLVDRQTFGAYEMLLWQTRRPKIRPPHAELRHRGKTVYLNREAWAAVGSSWLPTHANGCETVRQSRLILKWGGPAPGMDLIQKSDVDRLKRTRASARWFRMGADVTGNGVPNLILLHAGYPTVAIIFELGRKFRVAARIEIGLAGSDANFVDLDGDGFPEIEAADSILQGWHDVQMWARHIPVVLKLKKGRYQPYIKAMYKPPLSRAELLKHAKAARGLRAWTGGKAANKTHVILARLIYTGRAKQAKELLRLSWPAAKRRVFAQRPMMDPPTKLTRSQYWNLLLSKLSKSSYYESVLKLNGGRLPSAGRGRSRPGRLIRGHPTAGYISP